MDTVDDWKEFSRKISENNGELQSKVAFYQDYKKKKIK